MQVVLMSQRNHAVNSVNALFADPVNVLSYNVPAPVDVEVIRIGHRDSDKIKTPVAHPLEMFLRCFYARPGWIWIEEVKKVKTFPSGQRIVFRDGECTFPIKAHACGCHRRCSNEVSSFHRANKCY